MKRQRIRFGSTCRDVTGVFHILKIEVALVEDGTIQTDIEIERILDNGMRGWPETYTLPGEADSVAAWQVLEL